MASPSMQRAEQEMGAAPPNEAPIVEQVSTDQYRPVPAQNLNNPAAGAADVGRPPVADVTLDYDPNFKKLVTGLQNQTPENNLETAKIIKQRVESSDKEHYNERFQPGAFLVAFLRGRIDDMYTAYNGGRTYAEQGKDALDNVYSVIKNQRGVTGRVEDANKNELSTEEIKRINKERGGILTASDRDALQSANWKTAQKAIEEARNGDTSQLNAARFAAKAAANYGAAENPLLGDEIYLAEKLRPVLNHISTLDPRQRQLLLGYAQRYRNAAGSLQSSAQKYGGTSLSDQQQFGGSLGPFGGQQAPGAGGKAGVPPTAGFNASLGGQQGTSQSQTNAQDVNRSNSIQEMQDMQTAIMQQLQGVIKPGQEFQDFVKLTALNQSNNESINKVPPEFMPPGWKKVAPVDLFMGGADSVIEQRYAQQTNNALIAAYQADLFKAQRQSIETGRTIPVEDVYRNFEKSDLFKGLVNYGIERVHTFTKRGSPLQKGSKIYNPNTGKLDTYGE